MGTTFLSSAACRNCGASLRGRFCSSCGQEDRPLDPSVSEVVGEVAREISALDGRILRSVRHLLLSPGFLTMQHFEGRRAGWVSPVRLYLVFSVCYFAMTSIAGGTPLSFDLTVTGRDDEDTRQAVLRLGFSTEEELRRAINQALTTWIPRAMFVLVPLFGWLVSLLRRRSGRNYPHHLIFALHAFGMFFGVQSIAVAGGYVTGNETVRAVLTLCGLVYALVYIVFALRAVYGGTIARAVVHTIVLLTLYWVATILAAAAIVLPVVF